MNVFSIIKNSSQYWMGIGTIIVLYSSFQNGELSLRYIFAVLILWGLLVGLPSYILYTVGSRFERKTQEAQTEKKAEDTSESDEEENILSEPSS
jgi:hypothetical protein